MIKSAVTVFLKSLPLLVVILVVFQVGVTNELAGMGQNVTDIESQVEAVTVQNELLRQQVASASSLLLIEQKAKEQGLTEPKATSYLSLDPLPLALSSQ